MKRTPAKERERIPRWLADRWLHRHPSFGEMGKAEHRLYGAFAEHVDTRTGVCWPALVRLGAVACIYNRRDVLKHRDRLIELDLIAIRERGGPRSPARYIVHPFDLKRSKIEAEVGHRERAIERRIRAEKRDRAAERSRSAVGKTAPHKSAREKAPPGGAKTPPQRSGKRPPQRSGKKPPEPEQVTGSSEHGSKNTDRAPAALSVPSKNREREKDCSSPSPAASRVVTRLRAMDARTSPAEAQRALDDAGPENVEDMIKRVRAWWEEDTSRNALRHFRGLVKLARESPDGYRRADAPFDADGDADFPGYSPALRRAAREMAARGLKASDPEGARILRDAAR